MFYQFFLFCGAVCFKISVYLLPVTPSWLFSALPPPLPPYLFLSLSLSLSSNWCKKPPIGHCLLSLYIFYSDQKSYFLTCSGITVLKVSGKIKLRTLFDKKKKLLTQIFANYWFFYLKKLKQVYFSQTIVIKPSLIHCWLLCANQVWLI